MHIVVARNMRAAIEDWRQRLVEFRSGRLTGTDNSGRTIRFIPGDDPRRLCGLVADSYDLHGDFPPGLRAELIVMLDVAVLVRNAS